MEMFKELTSLRLVMSSRFAKINASARLFLQTDEEEKLDKEAADKPAGKNSITLVHDYYQLRVLLELNSGRHFGTPSSWWECAIYDITL